MEKIGAYILRMEPKFLLTAGLWGIADLKESEKSVICGILKEKKMRMKQTWGSTASQDFSSGHFSKRWTNSTTDLEKHFLKHNLKAKAPVSVPFFIPGASFN